MNSVRTISGFASIFELWLIPLIVVDFTLLPMFHTAGLPWKPGYLAILVGVFIYARKMPLNVIVSTRPIFIIFMVLSVTAVIGAMIFEIQTSYGASTATLRAITIYTLGALAFLVGVGDRRPNHHYLLIVIFAFAALNVIHSVIAADSNWMSNFYHTEGLSEGEVYARGVRISGIMSNPNITALTATILLMFVTVGFKSGHTRPSISIGIVSIVLTGVVVVMMLSRNQILAASIVSLAMLLYLPVRMGRQTIGISAVIIAIVLVSLVMIGNDRQGSVLGVRLTENLQSRWTSSGITSSGLDRSLLGEGGIARPLHGASAALERFKQSPIFGTGFEASDQIPAPQFHNDWATVLASGGLIGLAAFIALAIVLVRIDPLLGLPLIFPGLTNSLLFAPQHFVLLMVLAGLVAGQRRRKQRENEKISRPNAMNRLHPQFAA